VDNDVDDVVEDDEMPQVDFELNAQLGVPPTDIDSVEYNKFLFKTELLEHKNVSELDHMEFLYPQLNDPNFNAKLANFKEFNDTKYDGEIYNMFIIISRLRYR